MQAAFIDIGMERTAFLHASTYSIRVMRLGARAAAHRKHPLVGCRRQRDIGPSRERSVGDQGRSFDHVYHSAVPILVYMPKGHGVGVSARIENESERERLRAAVQAGIEPGENAGYIVRTAAEDAPAEAVQADMVYLRKLWGSCIRRACGRSRQLGDADCRCIARPARLAAPNVDRVLIDQASAHREMCEFAGTSCRNALRRIDLYGEARPVFELHHVEEEIQKALDRKVSLKSGGYLIIDQTEAMTTIDVNTGAFVGHRNLEETIFRTNLEAAVTIGDNCACASGRASSSSISSTWKSRITAAKSFKPWKKLSPTIT